MDLPSDATARREESQEGLEEEVTLRPLKERIAAYYSEKVRRHGATPSGVDWTCEPTQQLRFVQLLRLCDFSHPLSINDVGCGWGALLPFIAKRHRRATLDYLGTDLSESMIAEAKRLWARRPRTAFAVGGAGMRVADYSVASGIFNVQIDEPLRDWEAFVEETLQRMARTSRRGFAVNFLRTLPPDVEGRSGLYRTEPDRWMDFFVRTLGCKTELLGAYGMREFTLLARH